MFILNIFHEILGWTSRVKFRVLDCLPKVAFKSILLQDLFPSIINHPSVVNFLTEIDMVCGSPSSSERTLVLGGRPRPKLRRGHAAVFDSPKTPMKSPKSPLTPKFTTPSMSPKTPMKSGALKRKSMSPTSLSPISSKSCRTVRKQVLKGPSTKTTVMKKPALKKHVLAVEVPKTEVLWVRDPDMFDEAIEAASNNYRDYKDYNKSYNEPSCLRSELLA